MKDLPDIALLATARIVDGAQLRTAIQRTFDIRGTHDVPDHVRRPPSAWAPIYERIARIDRLQWKTLDELTQAVRDFLDPVLSGDAKLWDPVTRVLE